MQGRLLVYAAMLLLAVCDAVQESWPGVVRIDQLTFPRVVNGRKPVLVTLLMLPEYHGPDLSGRFSPAGAFR